jgi:hypothetical protein
MKYLLVAFLVTALFVVAPDPAFAFVAPIPASIPVDLFAHYLSVVSTHHLSVASITIAAPSYTINQWCELRKYSRAEWYRMRARGDGPEVIGAGRMTRVTPAADARWLRTQERKAKAERQAAE